MNVGTICYATHSGLGILAKAFYDHGIIQKVLRVPHPHYHNVPDWFPGSYSKANYRAFLASIDTLLLFENGFYWSVIAKAKQMGKRIVLMPMYEYTPFPCTVAADLYLCPSALDQQYYQDLPSAQITVPVEQPWKLRTRARRFVHNAGHGGKDFRNGTPELLEAMQYVKSPIELLIRGQPGEKRIQELYNAWQGKLDPRVRFVLGNVPDNELYRNADVFIFPEKFNGLSLPLQEAYANGMLVMAANRFPVNTWLPTEPLISVNRYEEDHIAVKIQKAVIEPRAVAEQIDTWYDQDITRYSIQGREWAGQNSWDVLKPKYLELLGANNAA